MDPCGSTTPTPDRPGRAAQLVERYGYLMRPGEVVEVLRLKSVEAFRKARSRGKLTLAPVPGPSREKRYSTAEVAALLDAWETRQSPQGGAGSSAM
jgi:hypothetical protein